MPGLLLKPGGFEGLVTVRENPKAGQQTPLHCPHEDELLVQLHTARLGGALGAARHDHLIPCVYELVRLNSVVVPDFEEVPQALAYLGPTARPGLYRFGGLLPREVRRQEISSSSEVPAGPLVVNRAYQLHVLLRHRPRSISLARRQCQGRHPFTDKPEGLALPVIEVAG